MIRTASKLALILVGTHLLLGAILFTIDATKGISDQSFIFALSMLYYYLNYPAILILKYITTELTIGLTILAGIPQWILLSFILAPLISLRRTKKTD